MSPHAVAVRAVRPLSVLLLVVLGDRNLPAQAPGPVVVAVRSQSDGKPAAGIVVRLGPRYAATGLKGEAIFDGVPAGTHRLVVAQAGFDRLEREVALPPGKRAPIEIALVPERRARLEGQVLLEDLGLPVPGARVVLVPIDVPAAVRGPLRFTADWDGKFVVPETPCGTYRAEVRAEGCRPAARDVVVDADGKIPPLAIERVVEPASLSVRVVDAAGRAIPGADVVLAEAFPRGEIRRGKAGPDGAVRFDDLKVAQLNWADGSDKVSASRRHVTLHAAAPGYAPLTIPVALAPSAAATVSLFALREIEEREPNGDMSRAQEIDVGATVRYRIAAVGDQDWFQFRLPQPGRLQLALGGEAGYDTYFELLDSSGKKLARRGAYANVPNGFDLPLPAGGYYLVVSDWGDDEKRDRLQRFQFEFTAMPDPLGPNGSPQSARQVRAGEEIRGYFLAGSEADCYRFVLRRPSTIRAEISAEPFQRHLEIRRADGTPTGSAASVYAGPPLVLVANLAPGEYVLVATEWGKDQSPMAPAAIELAVIEDDGWDDTPSSAGAPRSPRVLEPDGIVATTILPLSDVDCFAVSLPSSGTLQVVCCSVHEQELRVLSEDGGLLGRANAYGNGSAAVDCPVSRAQTIFVQIREWGDDEVVLHPYVLRAGWHPSEEAEAAHPNDTPEHATPFEDGDTLCGTFSPLADVDLWRMLADRPGRLELAVEAPSEIDVAVLDGRQDVLGYRTVYPGSHAFWASVPPGDVYVRAREWGSNAWVPASYAIRTRFLRADPEERMPLRDDPVRELRLGEARPFKFEHLKDRDVFQVALPAAGKYVLVTSAPFERQLAVSDALTGKKLFDQSSYPGESPREFAVEGPARLRIEATEWGENECSMEEGLLLVAPAGKTLAAERLVATVDRTDPLVVSFAREPLKPSVRALRALLDADGDGRPDAELPAAGSVSFRYAAEGVYSAQAWLEGAGGTRSIVRTWVPAVGYHEKKGVRLLLSSPRPGATIESGEPIRAAAISYSGARIAHVQAAIDGVQVGTAFTPPYSIDVAWDALGPGEHRLEVVATDGRGERAAVERTFQVSEFFDLVPRDGAQVTGERVLVSWSGRSFGPGAVRVRKAGAPDWLKTVEGESGRVRRVPLSDLEPGVAYEFQPIGRGEGPVRTVTRVKGLAFGRARYAASIRRDYDQRVPISVRNHGEKSLAVRLECGKPPPESKLLAGFVGDGSDGAPFDLAPGEERDFLLGVSAQDCVARKVAFPVRLAPVDSAAAEAGTSDTAFVELDVQLPNVALEWESKEELPGGLGRILVLRNKGDTVTDLAVGSNSPDLLVSPTLEHGMLPAGRTMEFRVAPRLYEGFHALDASLVARALDRTAESAQKFALEEGQTIHAVDLAPATADRRSAESQRLCALGAAYLNPASVDWSTRRYPQDSDNDGRPDRWTIDIPAESTRWIGLDTNGDGEIDVAHADVGFDGIVDFAAILGEAGWEETNIVESWLEIGFQLPWARSSYEKHDVDVVVNDTVVGKLRDTIPEGNYAFRIPPPALRFTEEGTPARNEVRIESKHLRGGHYVVSSDFRMKVKLTGTRVYAAAASLEEARKRVLATPGLSLSTPDLSVSSQEMRVRFEGEPKGGAPMVVTVPLRNFGAAPARLVDVALRFSSGAEDIELARVALPEVPVTGTTLVEIPARAPAGQVALKVVVDPEGKTGDRERSNNECRAALSTAGDRQKPTIEVEAPADRARLEDPVVAFRGKADDDAGVARVEVRVDRGLWTPLSRGEARFSGKALLQPGTHALTFRAIDASGNVAERAVEVAVTAPAPAVEIVSPKAGAKIDQRTSLVALKCSGGTVAAAVRAGGGPWQRAAVRAGAAEIPVPLAFGSARLEAMAVDARGVRGTARLEVECTRQPSPEEAADADRGGPRTMDIPGLGAIDPFGEEVPVFADSGGGPRAPEGAGPARTPDGIAEGETVPDEPGPDGNYGSEPPEGADPAALDGLDLEEEALDGPEGDDEMRDFDAWFRDPDVDAIEDPEFVEPAIEDPDWQPPDFEDWDGAPVDSGTTPGAEEDEGARDGAWPLPPPADWGEAGGPAGGQVAVREERSDWYCTNRPSVGVGFRLPDWLMRKKLPKPGTKEFEEALQSQLAELRARGFDTSKIEAFRKILKDRCARLESPEALPDFLQSLGFKEPNVQDPAELARWREAMANSADAFLLRLLHSGDADLIARGLRARLDALGKFDQASQDSAQAVIETIQANQRIAEDVAMVVPYLNVALSLRGLATGESLGGEKLSAFQRVLNGLALVGPAMSLLKNPTLRSVAANVGHKAMWLGENTIGRLAARLGLPVDRLKGAFRAMSEALGRARIAAGERLFGKAWAAEQRFLNSAARKKAMELAQQDLRQAKSLLERIAQARAGGDKELYRKLVGLLQGNKTAQALLNSNLYSNAFRAALDRTHRAMARLADKRTIGELMKNPKVQAQIQALAKRFGVNAGDIVIKASNVSGNIKRLKDLKPGEFLKYGADRDVVYQFVTKQGRALRDVHHKVVEPIYARNLREIAGRSLYEMDHVVTSRWHAEAYNAGLNPNTKAGRDAIAEIISGKSAGRLGRPTDIRDTVIHKGKEWMDAGDKIAARGRPALANQKIREGMRQMVKEYDRQVAQFLQAKGLDPSRALPPRLRQGLEIFRKVQRGAPDGSFTVEQAKAMLEAMTPKGGPKVTPQTIAEDLGYFVEFLNKWGLKTSG